MPSQHSAVAEVGKVVASFLYLIFIRIWCEKNVGIFWLAVQFTFQSTQPNQQRLSTKEEKKSSLMFVIHFCSNVCYLFQISMIIPRPTARGEIVIPTPKTHCVLHLLIPLVWHSVITSWMTSSVDPAAASARSVVLTAHSQTVHQRMQTSRELRHLRDLSTERKLRRKSEFQFLQMHFVCRDLNTNRFFSECLRMGRKQLCPMKMMSSNRRL